MLSVFSSTMLAMVVVTNHDKLSVNINDEKQEQPHSCVAVHFRFCNRPPKLLIGHFK
jgi:hypothetical protein